MICDCHLHTEFSGDSNTPVRLQIEKAIGLGMKELCITDHHDYDSGFCDDNFILDVPAYLEALRKLKEEYKNRIRLNIGIELGLQAHLHAYLHQFIARYGSSFDFIIGSSHFVKRMDPYGSEFWDTYGEVPGLEAFFKASLTRAQHLYDCFDSFGHLDYAVRYAPHQNGFFSYQQFGQWIDPLLKTLIDHGKALECNTGGFKYGLNQPNPGKDILLRYREMGGELITIGSDAHTPEYLGFSFQRCRDLLTECGFKYYAVFHQRIPKMEAL